MKNLRVQLLLILTGFIFISILTALYTANFFKKREDITTVSSQVLHLEINLLKAFKEQENFFNFEISNEAYFKNYESSYLVNYEAFYFDLVEQIHSMQHGGQVGDSASVELEFINQQLIEFNLIFQNIVKQINGRGYRNYGLEGKMREAIHKLEDVDELNLSDILTLRRHEKDFILRQDLIYLEMHMLTAENLRKELILSKSLSKNKKDSILLILKDYTEYFSFLVDLETTIGLKSNTGLKNSLNEKTNELIYSLSLLKKHSLNNQNLLLAEQNLFVFCFWFIYITLAIVLSFKVSKKFTHRLRELSNRINYFVNTNFTSRMQLTAIGGNDEVTVLWNNIMVMEQEIVDYIELFKEKVDEKTLELSYKNEKIELQKKKLEIQKVESDRKNKDLMDGMKYGWRLQSALLPSSKRLNKQLKDGFVFFAPKDIVSGDIYWSHKVVKKEGEECIFSVIDCTGHGVPGAFMSILAINAINDAALTKRHREPQHIMQATNNYVYKTMKYYLNKEDSNLCRDGMDMIICNLNRSQLLLRYAGAHRALLIVRKVSSPEDFTIDLEDFEYKITKDQGYCIFEVFPTKNTVGTLNEKLSTDFVGKTFGVKEKDMLYLTSDGYADQFGGPKDKKFMTKRLKKLLTQIHDYESEKQKEIIRLSFSNWKQDKEQVDDVSILAVRV